MTSYSREDVTGVADKLAGGEAGVEVPETEGLVPRGREGELAVGGDDNVRDEVVVAVEDLLGETERRLVTGELPDNDGLVWMSARTLFWGVSSPLGRKLLTTRGSEDHVGVLGGGSDGGDPAGVAGERALVGECLRHF